MSETHWTDDDIESMLKTAVFALAVGVIVLFVFVPRREQPQQQRRRHQPHGQRRQRQVVGGNTGAGTGTGMNHVGANQQQRHAYAQRTRDDDDEDGIQAFLKQHIKRPSHHVDNGDAHVTSAAHRNDGILPFRLTKASIHESKKLAQLEASASSSGDEAKDKVSSQALENRKDRARVFAKLFASKNITPPSHGGALVLSIPAAMKKNAQLTQVLFSLGTYYNLFVMVALVEGNEETENVNSASAYNEDKKRSDEIVQGFYSSHADDDGSDVGAASLSKDVLPPHRIVITKSVPSRIAFVRSFPKNPDIVIGFDEEEELMTQLTKFGYNVMLHKSASVFGV